MSSLKNYKFKKIIIIKAILSCILNFIKCIKKGYFDILFLPIDANKPLPSNALDKLAIITKNLNELNINYIVTDGTILGLYRDGGLIKHDNDIDIALIDSKDLLKLVKNYLNKNWIILRILVKNFHIYQIIFYKDGLVLDFCNWKKKNDFVYFRAPEINGLRKQPSYYYEPVKYNLSKIVLLSHPNLRQWICEHYGEDWETPKKSKGDWREDCKDIIEFK